jgi:hypothetical protein
MRLQKAIDIRHVTECAHERKSFRKSGGLEGALLLKPMVPAHIGFRMKGNRISLGNDTIKDDPPDPTIDA